MKMPPSEPIENLAIIRPPQSTRRFMSGFWFAVTATLLWMVWQGSQNHPATPGDLVEASAFFGAVWLFITYIIFKQVTMLIEIDDRDMTFRSVFKKPRKISIDDVESAYCVFGNKGALILHIDFIDRKNGPVSFPINLFAPADAERIKTFFGGKYTLNKNKRPLPGL
jgi:hypothetical protein